MIAPELDDKARSMLARVASGRGKNGPAMYSLVRLGLVQMVQYRDGKPPHAQITEAGRTALNAPAGKDASWRIASAGGVDLGLYSAPSAPGALDALARAAGCASHAVACRAIGASVDDWTTNVAAFRRGGIALLVTMETP